MASEKLSNLVNLAGAQVPTDLAYVVDVSAGTAGSKRSTLNDLFSEITKNITDGAVRFGGFAAPAVSAAGKGAVYFDSTANVFEGSRNAGAYEPLLFGSGSNTQVAVWNTTVDSLIGYATCVFELSGGDGANVLALRSATADTSIMVQSTLAARTGYVWIQNQGRVDMRSFNGTGNTTLGNVGGTLMTFSGGRDGPAYPQTNQPYACFLIQSSNNISFTPSAFISFIAGQNHSGTALGTGMALMTCLQSTSTLTTRLVLTANGVWNFAPNSSTLVNTAFGTNNRFVIGHPTTNVTALAVIGGQNNIRQLVVQGFTTQTNPIFDVQNSAGTSVFSVSDTGALSNSGALTITASSANALAVGPNGTTNPTLNVVTNVASAATGLSITGNAAGAGVTLTATSSGADESITLSPKGNANVGIGVSAPGVRLDVGGEARFSNLANNSGLTLRAAGTTETNSFYFVNVNNTNEGGFLIDRLSAIFKLRTPTGLTLSFDPADVQTLIMTSGLVRVASNSNPGSLIVGPSSASIGTAGVAVLAIGGSTAPTSSPADLFQLYSLDWNGGGTAAPHFRTEDGTIWRLGGTALSTSANAVANLGTAAESFIQLFLDQTLTATGTTGNQTINKSAGSVNFAAAATTLTVTCNKCTANSIVICTVLTNDTTATVKNVVPAAGSFVITLGAAATAETRVGFWVLNQ